MPKAVRLDFWPLSRAHWSGITARVIRSWLHILSWTTPPCLPLIRVWGVCWTRRTRPVPCGHTSGRKARLTGSCQYIPTRWAARNLLRSDATNALPDGTPAAAFYYLAEVVGLATLGASNAKIHRRGMASFHARVLLQDACSKMGLAILCAVTHGRQVKLYTEQPGKGPARIWSPLQDEPFLSPCRPGERARHARRTPVSIA